MRTSLPLATAAVFVAVLAEPAAAGVDTNPRAILATDPPCVNGLEAEDFHIVGRTGRAPGVLGVATSVHMIGGPSGPILATAFEVPGDGLDAVTRASRPSRS